MGRFAKKKLTPQERADRLRRRLERRRQIKGSYVHRDELHGQYEHPGDQALVRLVSLLDMPGVSVIVSGEQRHSKYVEDKGYHSIWQVEKPVRSDDLMMGYIYRRPDIECPLNDLDINRPAAGAFICERLQKAPNVREYLTDLRLKVALDAPVAFVVPIAHWELVTDHVNLFTEGTLIYNLVLAGWNCRDARVFLGPRHIEVILRRVDIPDLVSTSVDDIGCYTPYKKIHNYCNSGLGEAK